MFDESSDMLKLCPTRKKNWLLIFFYFFLRHGTEQSIYGLFFVFTFAFTHKNALYENAGALVRPPAMCPRCHYSK